MFLDASRGTVDSDELTEEHDELQTILQERESDTTVAELNEICDRFTRDEIMVDAVRLQLKTFTDRCVVCTGRGEDEKESGKSYVYFFQTRSSPEICPKSH